MNGYCVVIRAPNPTFLQLVLHVVEPVDEVSDLDARLLPLGLHPLSELPEIVKGCRQRHVSS
jgi:hypothetical protein